MRTTATQLKKFKNAIVFLCGFYSFLAFPISAQDTLRHFDFEELSTVDTILILDKGPIGHHAGLFNGERSSYLMEDGKIGKCITFDGTANAIAISTSKYVAETQLHHLYFWDSLIGTQHDEFTAAMWLKTSNAIAPGVQQLFGLGDGEGFFLYLKNGNINYDAVTLSSDDPYNFFFTRTTQTLKKKWSYGTAWTHVAMVFEKGVLRLFVNGSKVAQDTLKGYTSKDKLTEPVVVIPEVIHSFLGEYEGVSIGGGYGWKPYDAGATSGWMKFSNFYKGSMDELYIFDYSLDSADICKLPGNPCNYTGIGKPFAEQGIKVYPNPAKNEVFVEFDKAFSSGVRVVELFNNSGRMVQQFAGSESNIRMDLQNYPSGLYFIRVSDGKCSESRKIVVNR